MAAFTLTVQPLRAGRSGAGLGALLVQHGGPSHSLMHSFPLPTEVEFIDFGPVPGSISEETYWTVTITLWEMLKAPVPYHGFQKQGCRLWVPPWCKLAPSPDSPVSFRVGFIVHAHPGHAKGR